jgi:hypothetical protein
VRELLIDNEDGLTVRQISEQMGLTTHSIRQTIKNTWGVYVDRWVKKKNAPLAAVYMCVHVPPNTPKPD